MDNEKLSEQKIKIPQWLSTNENSLFATTYATCADWCDEICPGSSECGMSCTCAGQNNQDPCTCSNEGGQCTCSNQNNQQLENNKPTATGRITSIEEYPTSLVVYFTTIPKATSYEVVWRYPDDTALLDSTLVSSSPATIEGLIPSTDYIVNYRGSNDYGDGPFMSSGKPATTTSLLDPWKWWSDVSRDATIAISADEWNAFCDFINEVRVQRGLSRYTAGNFGSMTSDEILSAEGYDHAVYAIGAMIPGFTQEYGRLSEDQIEASLFNGLKDGINSLLV